LERNNLIDIKLTKKHSFLRVLFLFLQTQKVIVFMASFKQRWNITSNFQMIIILIVFAITGSTAAYIAKPFLALLGITKTSVSLWLYYPLYIIIILPIYKVLLVFIGTIFGQYQFFYAFVLKMLRSMRLGFIANWFDNKK
jgi:hypothetical protein